jgi:phosphate starvation-inducible PhoH-like protein
MGKQLRIKHHPKPEIDYAPKTQVQAELFHDLDHNNLLVVLGHAGTGKTYTCCVKAAQWLVRGVIDRIILARANVPTGRSLGAIPGTLQEKLEPWTLPMTDVLKEKLGASFYEYLVSKERIQTVALETIRGRSFDNAFILIDECQQLTLDEIKAISTRVGEHSVLVFMGDPQQSDLKHKDSPILKFIDLLKKHKPEKTSIIEFDLDDIVRSDICASMVKMFYLSGY